MGRGFEAAGAPAGPVVDRLKQCSDARVRQPPAYRAAPVLARAGSPRLRAASGRPAGEVVAGAMTGPLSGLRIVTTLPPHPWFGGIDYNFAVEMTEELRLLGATVFELHIGSFITNNDIYIRDAIQALKSFRPDVALALPNALYALLCRDAKQNNVFKDILQIPTIMLW